jgi:hypothetical protein
MLELPEPAMLVVERVQVRPGAEIEVERLTVLAKPSIDAILIVEPAVVPASTALLVGLADIEKSWTVMGMIAK